MSAPEEPRLRSILQDFGNGVIGLMKDHPEREWEWKDLEPHLKRTFAHIKISNHSPDDLPSGVLELVSNKLSAKDASNFRKANRSIREKVAVDALDGFKEYRAMVDFLYDFAKTENQVSRDEKKAEGLNKYGKLFPLERLLTHLDVMWNYPLTKIVSIVREEYCGANGKVHEPWAEWRATLSSKTRTEMKERISYEALVEILRVKKDIAARTLIVGYFSGNIMKCPNPTLRMLLHDILSEILSTERANAWTEFDLEVLMKTEGILAFKDLLAKVMRIIQAEKDRIVTKYNIDRKSMESHIRMDYERRIANYEVFLGTHRGWHSRRQRSMSAGSRAGKGGKSGLKASRKTK